MPVVTMPHLEQIRELLLKLSDVSVGQRFGGEAFFFRKRFFCHFHPVADHFFLETFVWDKTREIVRQVPGAIPHPEYGNYGWVRFPILSQDDVPYGLKLVETTYRYLRTIKRVSIRKDRFSKESLDSVRDELRQLSFKVNEAKKTIQVLIEAPYVAGYDEADELLEKAVKMLKT